MASSSISEGASIDEAYEYYRTIVGSEGHQNFKNLDDAVNLEYLLDSLQSSSTFNFVLDFSDTASWVCFDANTPTVAALLAAERPETLNTRWINIWYPSRHASLLQLLAQRYDFSPRLLALMCSDPREPRTSQSTARRQQKPHKKFRRFSTTQSALEDGLAELSEDSSITSYDSITRGNLYKIIGDLWHYSSIDFGRNYVCIGYNSLYGTKHGNDGPRNCPLPHCIRVWTWLVLCEDSTVISINEDPFPFSDGRLDSLQQLILAETRRNIVSVFRSLSAVEDHSLMTRAPMTLLPIRARLGCTPEETANRQKDTPGLLFYYLFENWHNSYTLITRKESRYGLELTHLRTEMFHSPTLNHIDRLDSIGKELNILKRHYESYNRLIDRLLEPQQASTASIQNMRISHNETASQTSLSTIRPLNQTDPSSTLGVSLPSPARVRFTRLRDLIDLYALSEVAEYLQQKDSLVTMNFQLIAIKESLDVEKLTRTTLLLTKCTMLFLPISLLTTYFSVPLQGMVYGARQYWIAFGVTLGISIAALFGFGVVSGSVQMDGIWRAVRRGLKGMRDWVRDMLDRF